MACDREVLDLMLPLWGLFWRYGTDGELFFFLLEKEPLVLRELSRLEPSIGPHGELLLLWMQKKQTLERAF